MKARGGARLSPRTFPDPPRAAASTHWFTKKVPRFRLAHLLWTSLYNNDHSALHDCEPTVEFINMFWGVIAAMSSRCANEDALHPDNDSFKVLWDIRNFKEPQTDVSDRTFLKVTLDCGVGVIRSPKKVVSTKRF